MAKRKALVEIGYRTQQEVYRLFKSRKDAAMAIGCIPHLINDWGYGTAPSAIFLARLHELGADVIWILTGHHGQYPGQ